MTAPAVRRSLAAAGLIAAAVAAWFAIHRGGPAAHGTWVAGWAPARSFHTPRRALAAASDGRHVYVVGGVDAAGHYVRAVEFATIGAGGALGPWRTTSSLQTGRIYLAAAYLHGYLYALGGGTGPLGSDNTPSALVERARVNDDGSLGPWRTEGYMNSPRRGLKVVTFRRHLYAIGGYNGMFLKSTERADVDGDGHIRAWHTEPEQSVLDRYIHSAARWRRYIYLLGGHVHSATQIDYGDVEHTAIRSGGALAPWTIEPGALQVPRFVASAFAMGGYLYMVGGHSDTDRLRSVEYAPIHRNGRLGRWRFASPLRQARSATALAVAGRRVYVFGGMGDGILNTVETARQGADGGLGHTVAAHR